jgi:hypothetical protein
MTGLGFKSTIQAKASQKFYTLTMEPSLIYPNGRTEYLKDGVLHRIDGPAVIYQDYQAWYQKGKLHRIDGPAIKSKTIEEWHVDGTRHRVDGPAIIKADGTKEYWVDGVLHRADGPAIENKLTGHMEWHEKGLLHRVDGPAVLYLNSSLYAEFWEHGIKVAPHKGWLHPNAPVRKFKKMIAIIDGS